MERVSVVIHVKEPVGVQVELQPPVDRHAPSAHWQEKFAAVLKPLGNEGNQFRCCLCGTIEEVCSHLWHHQSLWMLLKTFGGDGAEEGSSRLALELRELLDTNVDLSVGRYVNELTLEEEDLDESESKVTISIRLETVRDNLSDPIGALRPSVPDSFVLHLDATKASVALASQAARECKGTWGTGIRFRIGNVEQPFQETVRFTLVLVQSWADVCKALQELDVYVQVPVSGSSTDYAEPPLDLSELIVAAEARSGTEIVTATVRSTALPAPLGEALVFNSSIQALRWVGPNQPAESGRSKDTDLWVEGLAADNRTWRISLEIRSLRLTSSTANAFVAYSYEPLQQPRPFRTNPPTIARKNNTALLKNSFAAYTVIATSEDLRAQFEDELRLEVWHRDVYKKDDLVGIVDVGLAPVFDKPLQHSQTMPSMTRGFRVLDQASPIFGCTDPPNRIGSLRVVIFVEDLGPALREASTVPSSIAPQVQRLDHIGSSVPIASGAIGAEASYVEPDPIPNRPSAADGMHVLRGTPAYKVACDLELWKHAEENKFRAFLAEQEVIHRDKLEEEYRQRELGRAKEFRQKQEQMRSLDEKTRKKFHELQQREVALAAEEARMSADEARLRSLREEERKRTDNEANHSITEAQQILGLERSRSRHLQSRVAELESELDSARVRAREAEANFSERRRQLQELPQAQLQEELQMFKLELMESRRNAESLAASRDHFRQKVVEQYRDASSPPPASALQHSQANPADGGSADMHTDIMPAPGGGDITGDLRKIQDDLAQIAKDWSTSLPLLANSRAQVPIEMKHSQGDQATTPSRGQQQQHLEWLCSQRLELLESGLYNDTDPVLMALDERIAEASARIMH